MKKLFEKIISKKEFSDLPKKDVKLIFDKFNKKEFSDEEKLEKTRDLLRKVYFAFGSRKLLNPKILQKKKINEILNKHISTKERFSYYSELYERLLKDFENKKLAIIDLGAGINGLSYESFEDLAINPCYVGYEAVGQLVDLMNNYFKTKDFGKFCTALKGSLFDLESVKKVIKIKLKKQDRVVFLFKTIDSLEMVDKNYSKVLLREIAPLVNRIVVSFATRSLIKKTKFKAKRTWLINFIKDNFKILDDFEIKGERYIVFEKVYKNKKAIYCEVD